jgi:hypothetical protein
MHRLLAFVDETQFDELPQCPGDIRLVLIIHRQVIAFPVAEYQQPLELGGHHIDELLSVGAAGAADLRDRHVALFRAKLAIDLQLDRKSVAVVTGDVRDVEAGHGLRLDHQVFEDLVERRTKVNTSVRVRRAVVKDKAAAAAALPAELAI